MSISLQTNPSPNDVLNFALSGFPFANAAFYGLNPSLRSALFTNGLAAGFPLDRGALFTTNYVGSDNGYTNPDGSGSVGINFDLLPKGAQTSKTVQISWCSCDIPKYDYGLLSSPGEATQKFDVNLPNGSPAMPQNQIPGNVPFNNACTCKTDSSSFRMNTGGQSSIGISFDNLDNSFFFIGQNNDPDLVTTTTTSYIATYTSTPTISLQSTTTTTTPYTYTTFTFKPQGDTITSTSTITSTVAPIDFFVTSTPAPVTATSSSKPLCTEYQLSFASNCCPRKYLQRSGKGSHPRPHPAIQNHPHPTPVPGSVSKANAGSRQLHRRQNPAPGDPPASSTISDNTLFITSFRTTTTVGAPTTVFTGTSTVEEITRVIASETAPRPDATTVTAADVVTIVVDNPEPTRTRTVTLAAVTTTVQAADVPCATKSITQFEWPSSVKKQSTVQKLAKQFLDKYKRLTSADAPTLSVHCRGDSNEYVY